MITQQYLFLNTHFKTEIILLTSTTEPDPNIIKYLFYDAKPWVTAVDRWIQISPRIIGVNLHELKEQ